MSTPSRSIPSSNLPTPIKNKTEFFRFPERIIHFRTFYTVRLSHPRSTKVTSLEMRLTCQECEHTWLVQLTDYWLNHEGVVPAELYICPACGEGRER